MAKVSSVQKNEKRRKMSASLAKKRADLKAKIYDKKLPLVERFALVAKLAAMPRKLGFVIDVYLLVDQEVITVNSN